MTLHPEEMENIEIDEAERKTALIVDDDKFVLKIYSRRLEDRGYSIKTAMNLEEVRNYKKEEFDLAIIDDLEGKCFDVLKIVNAKRKVIISGDFNLVEKARKKGIESYNKPIYIGDILKWKMKKELS